VTIFNYLRDIIVEKTGNLPLEEYSPYIISRWLSFINPTFGETMNSFNEKCLLEDKQIHYKTMLAFFPKAKSVPKINYCKKLQDTDSEQQDETILAELFEMSKKEVRQLKELISFFNSSNMSQIC